MADESPKSKNRVKSDPEGAMMYIACSRCKRILDVKPGNLGSITHSLCDACHAATMREIDDFKKKNKKGK